MTVPLPALNSTSWYSWAVQVDGQARAAQPVGRLDTKIYDEFSRYSNGSAISGLTPLVGNSWSTTGAQLPTVSSGAAVSTGTGYLYQTLSARPTAMVCEVTFTGTDPTAQPMTMAPCLNSGGTMLNDFVHFNFGPYGFVLTVRRDGGTFDPLIIGSWRTICLQDGTTPYRFSLLLRGNVVSVIGPNGEQWAIADTRVSQAAGPTVFWEPNTVTGGAVQLKTVAAMVGGTTGEQTPADLPLDRMAGFDTDNYGRAIGSQRSYGEVGAGRSPNSDMPSVMFGSQRIHTFLTASAAAGATSLTTAHKVPSGCSIQLDSGTNAETVTASGAAPSGSSPGPYGRALTAAKVKTHGVNTAVIATPTSDRYTEMYLNVENGFFFFPNVPVPILPGNNLYFGSGLTQFLTNGGTDLISTGSGDSFRCDNGAWNSGHLLMGAYHLWIDASGRLRVKNGAPTSDTDGTVVGTQT